MVKESAEMSESLNLDDESRPVEVEKKKKRKVITR